MQTHHVTWFSNEENQKGQIKVGQYADLIVPTLDYFNCAEEEIAGITSELTVVGGRIVYGAGSFSNLDENPPPEALPQWSPVREFGGYGAWKYKNLPGANSIIHRCARHEVAPSRFQDFWGSLGCECWAF